MSSPWVVTCKGCRCIIVCFATDPQAEHMKPEDTRPRDGLAYKSAEDAFQNLGGSWKRTATHTPEGRSFFFFAALIAFSIAGCAISKRAA